MEKLTDNPSKEEVIDRVDTLISTSGKSLTVKSIRNTIFINPREDTRRKAKMVRDALSTLSYKVAKEGRGNRQRYSRKELIL